jgi:hypothetical protein
MKRQKYQEVTKSEQLVANIIRFTVAFLFVVSAVILLVNVSYQK